MFCQCLYVGDFNCPHTGWDYTSNSADSDCLASWAGINNLIQLHNPKEFSSFYSSHWNIGTNSELAFFCVGSDNCQTDKLILKRFSRSQHDLCLLFHQSLLCLCQAGLLSTGTFARPIEVITLQMTNKLSKSLLPDSPDVDQAYWDFCNAIKKAANKSIPCGH